MVKLAADLMVDLLNSPGDDSSVLVIVGLTQHCKGLSSTSLTVAHNSSIVPCNSAIDNVRGSLVINIILSGVMQDGVELEFPVVKLIVDSSKVSFVSMNIKILPNKMVKILNSV